MINITSDSLKVIFVVLIFAIPLIILLIKRIRTKEKITTLCEAIQNRFSTIAVQSPAFLSDIRNQAVAERGALSTQTAKGTICKEDFIRINDAINKGVTLAKQRALGSLLQGIPELQHEATLVNSEHLSQGDLLNLVRGIERQRNLPILAKHELLPAMNKLFTNQIAIVDSKKLYSEQNIRNLSASKAIDVLKLCLLSVLGVCAVGIILHNTGAVTISDSVNSSPLPAPQQKKAPRQAKTIKIAAIGYIKEETFKNVTTAMIGHLESRLNRNIEFIYYTYDEINEVKKLIRNSKMHGVIMNPGTYYTYSKEPDQIFDSIDVFCVHREKGKRNYRSILVADASDFLNFCKERNYHPKDLDIHNPTQEDRLLIRDYILNKGAITLTHKNSMSGSLFPRRYLWRYFGIDVRVVSEGNVMVNFSGNHEDSIEMLFRGESSVIATYNTLYETKIRDRQDDYLVLFESPEIPFNSYWLSKAIDVETKRAFADAFVEMSASDEVKKNTLKITHWDYCSTEEYREKMEKLAPILGERLPRKVVSIKIRGQYYNQLPDEIARILTPLNAWHVISAPDEAAKLSGPGRLNGATSPVVNVTISSEQTPNSKFGFLITRIRDGAKEVEFELDLDSLSSKSNNLRPTPAAAREIAQRIWREFPMRPLVFDDTSGLFINVGSEGGITESAVLYLGDKKLDRGSYEIKKDITRLIVEDGEEGRKLSLRGKRLRIDYELNPGS